MAVADAGLDPRRAGETVLKRPKDSVRVLVGDIGGAASGQKTNLYPEDGIVAYAATKLSRKIAGAATAPTNSSAAPGRDLTSTGEFGARRQRRVLAYRVRSVGGTGAYSSGAANIIPLVLGPFVQSGVYDLPLVHYEVKSVMTHTAPVGAYRGAGRPEGVFIVERLMDAAARQIGMDPRAIRKVNYIKPAQLPYTNAVGQVYDPARSRTCWSAPRSCRLGRRRAQRRRRRRRPALRPRPHQLHRVDRRPRPYREGQPARHGRGARHPAFRHHGDGAGVADHVYADGVGRARHPHGQDRHRAGRYGSRHRIRQRRLALAVRRRTAVAVQTPT
jgi:CO/xanthine dehydrogenase Mo-binding subunit